MLSASVTRTTPSFVRYVVSRTFVRSRYLRSASNFAVGRRTNAPPFSASSSAASAVGQCICGKERKSIAPSSATSATVLPSPSAA